MRKIGKAMIEVCVVFAFPLAVYLLERAGLAQNAAIFLALGEVLTLDYVLQFLRRHGPHDAGSS